MPTNRHVEQAQALVYATTLVDAAQAEGGLDAVMADRAQLDQIVSYNRSHVELHDFLTDVAYTGAQRKEVVEKVFSDCRPELVSVLGVMAERGDFDKLPKVRGLFNDLLAEKLNVTVVDVTIRVSLDDHLREVIKNKAAADLGTDILLNETIDENMLGGIIMNANGKRIDASMDTMLANARSVLKDTDGGEC